MIVSHSCRGEFVNSRFTQSCNRRWKVPRIQHGRKRVLTFRVSASKSKQLESQVSVVLGTQWGDEGKGKLVDILAQESDVVCRAQVRLL